MADADTSKPTPDPTVLTTEQLHEAIDRVKELMLAKLEGEHDFCAEKFDSVTLQFGLVERQRVEQKNDTKAAVDAALAAAKEAVKEQTTSSDRSITKSETATSEQLKQITQTFNAAIVASDKVVSDLKERVVAIESTRQGGKETLTGIYALAGFLVSILVIGGIVAAYIGSH